MMEFQYRKMVQEIADTVLDNATINNIPFREWIDNVNNAYANKKCNLASCRYNKDGKCTNEEKRKECIDVAKSVLCIKDVEDKNPLNICETNENCECDPDKCSKAVDITMFSDLPFRKFICGRDKCKYCK